MRYPPLCSGFDLAEICLVLEHIHAGQSFIDALPDEACLAHLNRIANKFRTIYFLPGFVEFSGHIPARCAIPLSKVMRKRIRFRPIVRIQNVCFGMAAAMCHHATEFVSCSHLISPFPGEIRHPPLGVLFSPNWGFDVQRHVSKIEIIGMIHSSVM